MQLTIHIPDDILERVKDKLPPPEVGVLEAIAGDAILEFLTSLSEDGSRRKENLARECNGDFSTVVGIHQPTMSLRK
jgi:hypothetical protein